jgi:hypothetical protein
MLSSRVRQVRRSGQSPAASGHAEVSLRPLRRSDPVPALDAPGRITLPERSMGLPAGRRLRVPEKTR